MTVGSSYVRRRRVLFFNGPYCIQTILDNLHGHDWKRPKPNWFLDKFLQNVIFLAFYILSRKTKTKTLGVLMRGNVCRALKTYRCVGYPVKKRRKKSSKSVFFSLPREISFCREKKKNSRYYTYERKRLPHSILKSIGWLSQKKSGQKMILFT